MPRRVRALLLFCAGCASGASPPDQASGTQLVLEVGEEWGVAWSPLWCRAIVAGRQSCLRHMLDSSEIIFEWDRWRRPSSVARTWSRIAPIRAADLRDSLRQVLEHRGARRLADMAGPDAPEYRFHRTQMRWCLDGTLVTVARTWQEGNPLEGVGMLIGAAQCPRHALN
jgi:hypothetical protein